MDRRRNASVWRDRRGLWSPAATFASDANPAQSTGRLSDLTVSYSALEPARPVAGLPFSGREVGEEVGQDPVDGRAEAVLIRGQGEGTGPHAPGGPVPSFRPASSCRGRMRHHAERRLTRGRASV